MRPLPDRLNDRLEQQATSWRGEEQQDLSPTSAASDDPQIEVLMALSYRLRSAPSLEVDPAFARRLERRILTHNVSLQQKRSWWSGLFYLIWQPSFASLTISMVILCLVLGTGTLIAAQAAGPTSPLYGIRLWEQRMEASIDHSSLNRAEQLRQTIHNRLHTLANLTGPTQTAAYNQALMEVNQQINSFDQLVDAQPAGQDRDRLLTELTAIKNEARQTLRGQLPILPLAGCVEATDELAQLDDPVLQILKATVVLSLHAPEQATISITGNNLASGAKLIVNNQLVASPGVLQKSTYVFVIPWSGTLPPKSVGLHEPDETASQTNSVTTTIVSGDDNGGGSGRGRDGGGGSSGRGSDGGGRGR